MRVDRETAARNRAAIVRAAGRLFRDRGYGGVAIGEITRAAGLTHGGFYGSFASKEALAAEATDAAFAESLERLGRRPLGEWVRGYLSRIHRDAPEDGCPLVALAAEAGRSSPEVAAAMGNGAEGLISAIAERLATGADESPAARRARAATALALAVGGQVIARALKPIDRAGSDALLVGLRGTVLAALGEEADTMPEARTDGDR